MASTATVSEPATTERALILRAQAGERGAARVLVETHQRAVAGLLQRLLRGSGLDALTEDLAQETFLRGFAALSRFDPDGPARLSTWLLTIATRLALQTIARRRLGTEPLDELAIASPGLPFDESPDRARIGACIERAVGALAPTHRAVFLLREYHGLEYAEIAQALAIDLGTVKSRLSRARAALKQALEEVRHG
ncbi:MAG: RNA polymerase sigma factor [Deltaproteobacteria bacterium]|nr:RNA polymerase sigma factor [Nannocystaceae bacterium]